MKVLTAEIIGWKYDEGYDGFMVRSPIPDLLTISRARGELLFRQIETQDAPPHVIVFGWLEKCERLTNGKARVTVSPLSELHQKILLEHVQKMTEGNVIFWSSP